MDKVKQLLSYLTSKYVRKISDYNFNASFTVGVFYPSDGEDENEYNEIAKLDINDYTRELKYNASFTIGVFYPSDGEDENEYNEIAKLDINVLVGSRGFLLYRIGPLPFSMACRKRRLKSETNGCFPRNS